MRHRIISLEALADRFPKLRITPGMRRAARRYPFAATAYYLSLVREPSPSDPIFRQCVPSAEELVERPGLSADELCESSRYSPVPGLIHRYADRVVVLCTTTCPTYCRHCTRKRLVGRLERAKTGTKTKTGTDNFFRNAKESNLSPFSSARTIDAQVEYVRANPQIRDVILSGGDPLSMSTARLERTLARFRSVRSVEIIRVGTRAPVTLPSRVDDALCDMLARYHPVWVNTQFNHPWEVTTAAAAACDRLLRRGIPVNNQAVLLRGVNDSPEIMEELCRALLRIRVRPYYLFQCDPVAGIEHFRTPVSRGTQIMEHLFRRVGGLGVPRYAVDAVGGGGKVPISPCYAQKHEPGRLILRNFEGEAVTYPDAAPDCSAES